MTPARVGGIAAGIAAIVWLMLDSRIIGDLPPPEGASYALGAIGAIFGAGAGVMHFGGQPERVPLLAGMSIGLLGYAIARSVLF